MLCRDVRRLEFRAEDDYRTIDFDITVSAADVPVTFGDTKEGTFGVRVAGTMKETADMGGTSRHGSRIGRGRRGVGQAGRVGRLPRTGRRRGRSAWRSSITPVAFATPVAGTSRDYGLFAANVFGLHHFEGDDSLDAGHALQPGESMTFKHRVVLHLGDHETGKIDRLYRAYAAEER